MEVYSMHIYDAIIEKNVSKYPLSRKAFLISNHDLCAYYILIEKKFLISEVSVIQCNILYVSMR